MCTDNLTHLNLNENMGNNRPSKCTLMILFSCVRLNELDLDASCQDSPLVVLKSNNHH